MDYGGATKIISPHFNPKNQHQKLRKGKKKQIKWESLIFSVLCRYVPTFPVLPYLWPLSEVLLCKIIHTVSEGATPMFYNNENLFRSILLLVNTIELYSKSSRDIIKPKVLLGKWVTVVGIVILCKIMGKASLGKWYLSKDLKEMKQQAMWKSSASRGKSGDQISEWRACLAFMYRLGTNNSNIVVRTRSLVINLELYFTCWLLANDSGTFLLLIYFLKSPWGSLLFHGQWLDPSHDKIFTSLKYPSLINFCLFYIEWSMS